MADARVVVCPYCGAAQTAASRCGACHADFGPLSRRATQNQMGPWGVRDEKAPFRPGMSYELIVRLVGTGAITRYTILRGPSTGQLWTVARKTPGVAHLLGDCHSCNAKIADGVTRCPQCRTVFGAWLERNHLGLPEIVPMPGEPGALGNAPASGPHEATGFRPLASDGLSAFLHVEQAEEAPSAEPLPSEAAFDASDTPTNQFFDEALRAQLKAARRQSTRLLVVTVLAVLAAVATLAVVFFKGEDGPAKVAPPAPEPVAEVATPSEPPPEPPADQASRGVEQDLLAGLTEAQDSSTPVAVRQAALDRTTALIAQLRAGAPDAGLAVRLEEYEETADRLRQRLAFDAGGE